MGNYSIAGVYCDEVHFPPRRSFGTGVPAFLGIANSDVSEIQPITGWAHFASLYSTEIHEIHSVNYLAAAVRGFFQNGGQMCFVVPAGDRAPSQVALSKALDRLDVVEEVDLVCYPELMKDAENATALQEQIIQWCDAGQQRFAILDSLPDSRVDRVVAQWQDLTGTNAALYFPWLVVPSPTGSGRLTVPPCGHIAGCYARTDLEKGTFHAPANVALEGVYDLAYDLTNEEQKRLDPVGVVNCIRALPGRGIRPWGAHTISGQPQWRHINIRRLFLTLYRWFNINMLSLAFEPNDRFLWARIRRTVSAYLGDLYSQGALAGATPAQAFYVKCDASTTPDYLRNSGQVVIEIGISPVTPSEFIVVRIVYGAGQLVISGDRNLPGKDN